MESPFGRMVMVPNQSVWHTDTSDSDHKSTVPLSLYHYHSLTITISQNIIINLLLKHWNQNKLFAIHHTEVCKTIWPTKKVLCVVTECSCSRTRWTWFLVSNTFSWNSWRSLQMLTVTLLQPALSMSSGLTELSQVRGVKVDALW